MDTLRTSLSALGYSDKRRFLYSILLFGVRHGQGRDTICLWTIDFQSNAVATPLGASGGMRNLLVRTI
jgi:hypothetical protein